MSEPRLTDRELASLEELTSLRVMGLPNNKIARLVAEVRRLRAENQKLKSMLGRTAQSVGRVGDEWERIRAAMDEWRTE